MVELQAKKDLPLSTALAALGTGLAIARIWPPHGIGQWLNVVFGGVMAWFFLTSMILLVLRLAALTVLCCLRMNSTARRRLSRR